MRVCVTAVLLALVRFAIFGQQPPAQDDLVKANQEFVSRYKAAEYAEALEASAELLRLAKAAGNERAVLGTLYNQACVLALMGRTDDALEALERAVDAGYADAVGMERDADFRSLRGEKGFHALVQRVRREHGPAPLVFDPGAEAPEFVHRFDDPRDERLVALRREFAIDDAVAGIDDPYERVKALTAWTHRQWEHSPTQMASKNDPVTILREARAGGRFICQNYAVVLAGAAEAMGFPARVVNLMPADVETRSEAHSLTEVWVESLGKWVLADGQFGLLAETDGVPLDARELQAAIASGAPALGCTGAPDACDSWFRFLLPNMYYFKVARDQRRFDTNAPSQLVLTPKGAPAPKKFAGGNEGVFAGSLYTSNPSPFWAPPQLPKGD